MTEEQKSGRLWLWGIVIAIVVYIVWLLGFALFSFTQDVNLVQDHYYEEDLDYEAHMQRVALSEQLSHKPLIAFDPGTHVLKLHFPNDLISPSLKGSVQVYRPSDRKADRRFELNLNQDTIQVITLGGLQSGLWRVMLDWENEGFGYYIEDSFVVP